MKSTISHQPSTTFPKNEQRATVNHQSHLKKRFNQYKCYTKIYNLCRFIWILL